MSASTGIRRFAQCMLCVLVACACSSALAAERIALEGSQATVEVPDGWKRMSVGSSEPFALFYLCSEGAEPQPNGACTVRAEFNVEQLIGDRMPQSLDARFGEWTKNDASDHRVSAPTHFPLAGNEAIEVVTKGQHSSHIRKLVYFDTVVVRTADAYFACNLIVDPPDYMALQGIARSICGSLQLTNANPR